MVDGPTEATDHALTEANRDLVRAFVEEALIGRRLDTLDRFIDADHFTQHNPNLADGLPALRAALESPPDPGPATRYDRLHRVLAEGSFVLAVSEGARDGVHTAFYDLFRVAEGRLVEHWDTIEAVAPRVEWKNDNGKF